MRNTFRLFLLLTLARPCVAQRTTAAATTLARRIQLGATLAAVPDSLQARGVPPGAAVLSVLAGSSAADAGLQSGDILTRIGSDTIRTVADALAALRALAADHSVPVGFLRSGVPMTRVMVTRERPRETSSAFTIEYRVVAARGGKHRVLVTHPSDGQAHPAVLIIGGIGCYSIDAPTGELGYRDLAYHLTRIGYSTVRVEKLGVGDSGGASCLDTDFDTEVDGYRQALIAMKAYPSVDSSGIFLFGHSIGGIEAPLLASDKGAVPGIRGIAVLSTTGIAWYEYELANLRRQLRLQGLAPDSIERAMHWKSVCAFRFLLEKQSREAIVASQPLCAPYLEYPAADAYMQAVSDIPTAAAWKGVTASVLVMYATSDFITSRAEHLELTDDINAMHPGTARFSDVAGMDHYMSHQLSAEASLNDPVVGVSRPYYGATLEPVLDGWLNELSGRETANGKSARTRH